MNPLNVEKCMATYLEGVAGIASVIPVHESISAEDVDLNKSAIVVEAESTEHTSGNLYLATVNVSLRSPALSVSASRAPCPLVTSRRGAGKPKQHGGFVCLDDQHGQPGHNLQRAIRPILEHFNQ
jgi:hypothetical protein